MNVRQAPPEPLPALTSLRFFAAALIVLGHGGSTAYFDYAIHPIDVRQAVSFFFVLSGFILAHVYGAADWRTQWRAFLAARIARVWPLHLVTALIALLTVAPLRDIQDALVTLCNLALLHAAVPLTRWYYSVNSVSWTISTEMYFYLAFPFLVVAILRRRAVGIVMPALLCAAMLALALVAHLSPVESDPGVTAWGVLYISPLARALEFASGILAYRLAMRRARVSSADATPLQAAALVLCAAAMLAATQAANALDAMAAAPIAVWVRTAAPFPFFALLIGVLARGGGMLSQALSARALVYLGEISYALYMIHQLVLRVGFLHAGALARAHPNLAYATYWAVALAAAALLYHAVERPARGRLRGLLA
jgi:peptidoglycan/LPS O-acetylase OafA/YrhL